MNPVQNDFRVIRDENPEKGRIELLRGAKTRTVALSPDNRHFAITQGKSDTVEIYQRGGKTSQKPIKVSPSAYSYRPAFHPLQPGRILLAGDRLLEFDYSVGKSHVKSWTREYTGPCRSGSYSPNGQQVVAAEGSRWGLYDARSGGRTASICLPPHVMYAFAGAGGGTFSADGLKVSGYNAVETHSFVWDLRATQRPFFSAEGKGWINPAGDRLLAVWDLRVKLHDLRTNTEVCDLAELGSRYKAGGEQVGPFAHTGERFIDHSATGRLTVWDLQAKTIQVNKLGRYFEHHKDMVLTADSSELWYCYGRKIKSLPTNFGA